MDDLLGEDWQKPSKPTASTTPSLMPSFNAPRSQTQTPISIPVLPQSGRSTPQAISRPSSTLNSNSNGAAKGDQFGALLGLKSGKASSNNVSIQERQRQLVEEKRRQQEQQAHMWDALGSGSASGRASGTGTPDIVNNKKADGEEDIFAAFSKDAPVNKASHFPPPSSTTPTPDVPATTGGFDDDDDPFGLGSLPKVANGHRNVESAPIADDDVLGDLGKPVEPKPVARETAQRPPAREPTPDNTAEDGAVAELVDMGFPPDNAKIAIAESGGDVQRAVGWLLQQAHEESKQKARKEESTQRHRDSQPRSRDDGEAVPQWMRTTDRPSSSTRRHDSRSPAAGEKDAAAVAQELGNKLFKGANSLWKASQKQMAKTVADFQAGSGSETSSQPKWMQDSNGDASRSSSQRREGKQRQAEIDVTDEAAMLDMPRDRPTKPARSATPPTSELPRRPAQTQAQPRFMQQAPPMQDKRPATKLSRQEVEEQSAQAYVSPARRKRPTPAPIPAAEVDLFSPAPTPAPAIQQQQSSKPLPAPSTSRPAQTSRPTPSPRPQAPSRTIPQVSSSTLKTSSTHRTSGTEAFKRGDYASAHESYTSALAGIPQQHPIAIVILCNRALTALKTGDPKAAIVDADKALGVIGPANGLGETVEEKPMQEFWGKAIMRKAEGLEALEKWSDAAQSWRIAVEAGVGGAIAARGRDRCEKAGAPKPKSAPTSKPSAAARPKPKPATRTPGASEAAAVASLRAANAAATADEDARFAATDAVDARLSSWKSGKSDNLRALLQSLDTVLWEGAGWKKVGMADLVLPGKVKIVYMKAIGKVHPDKIPQDATVEQRMISASVFSTLNEAWDKFKADNGM